MGDSSQDACITFTKWNAVKDLLDLLIKDHKHEDHNSTVRSYS